MGPEEQGVWVFPEGAAYASIYPPCGLRTGVADIPIWLELAEQPPPILGDVVAGVHDGSQDRRTPHQYRAGLVPDNVLGLIVGGYRLAAEDAGAYFLPAVAALEDELETFVSCLELDLHVAPRGPVDAGHRIGLRLALFLTFLLQPPQVNYSREAVGGQDPAVVLYHRYPVPLPPFFAAYRQLGPGKRRLGGQLLEEIERDLFYVVSGHLFVYLLRGEQPAEDA